MKHSARRIDRAAAGDVWDPDEFRQVMLATVETRRTLVEPAPGQTEDEVRQRTQPEFNRETELSGIRDAVRPGRQWGQE